MLTIVLSGQGPSQTAEAGTFGTVTVTTAADNDVADGLCSYREAIKAQNMDAGYNGCTPSGSGPDRIVFDLGPGPVINISTNPALPLITATVEIDGGSERVELRGQGGYAAWLNTAAASGSIIHNLAMNRFSAAIVIDTDVSGVHVMGNFIGTDVSGTVGTGNSQFGILVRGPNALIGGTDGWEPGGSCTGQCNLISGHTGVSRAIQIDATGTGAVVQGNMIGTDVTGTDPLTNGEYGIHSEGANVLIGGESLGEGNLIGNAVFAGVYAAGDGTKIQGNFFGTDTTGNSLLDDEATGTAIVPAGAENTLIGGTSAGARNVIAVPNGIRGVQSAFNTQIFGNFIGTAADGTTPLVPNTVSESSIGVDLASASGTKVGGIGPGEGNIIAFRGIGVVVSGLNGTSLGNQIRGNSIYSNIGAGIVTESGGNNEPPPPVITSANQSGASGTSSLCAPCALEVYSDEAEEGRIYEGTTQTDLSGNWTFTGSITGPNVTAIRTDDGGNSSEFSLPFTIEVPTPTPSPSPTASPTPTATPTPTSTTTPSPTEHKQGDTDCNGAINARDSLILFLFSAGLPLISRGANCPDIGIGTPAFGDLNCDGVVDAGDGLGPLAFAAEVSFFQENSCTPLGQTL